MGAEKREATQDAAFDHRSCAELVWELHALDRAAADATAALEDPDDFSPELAVEWKCLPVDEERPAAHTCTAELADGEPANTAVRAAVAPSHQQSRSSRAPQPWTALAMGPAMGQVPPRRETDTTPPRAVSSSATAEGDGDVERDLAAQMPPGCGLPDPAAFAASRSM